MLDVLWRELLLNGVAALVGVAVSHRLVPSWPAWSRGLVAFPVGACVLVWLCLPMIWIGIGIVPAVAGVALGGICLLVMVRYVRDWWAFARGLAVAWLLAGTGTVLAVWLNATVITADSYELVFLGWAFNSPDTLAWTDKTWEVAWGNLNYYPVFAPVLHGVAHAIGLEYLASLSPLFAISTFGIMASVLARHERGTSIAASASITAAAAVFLFTSYFYLHQAFLVNSHTAMACFVTLSMLLIWSGRANGDFEDWRLLALSLPTISILRMEGMLVASLLAVLVAASDTCPRPARVAVLWSALLGSALWYVPLAVRLAGAGTRLAADDPLKYAAFFLLLAGPVVVGSIDRLRSLRPLLPALGALALLAVFVASTLLYPARAAKSLSSLATNLLLFAQWGACWFGLAGGLLLASFAPRFRRQGDFCFFLGGFLVVVIVPSIVRGRPYRLGWGDSANRMMIHVAPLIACYLGLVCRQLFHEARRRTETR